MKLTKKLDKDKLSIALNALTKLGIVNNQEIKSMLEQHYNNNVDFSVKLWNLFCLELWAEGNNANIL